MFLGVLNQILFFFLFRSIDPLMILAQGCFRDSEGRAGSPEEEH